MRYLWLCLVFLLPGLGMAGKVEVKLITDEADSVLAILGKASTKEAILEEDWDRLLQSEGYLRLKKREEQMKRTFTDEEFRKFVLSPEPAARAGALKLTLESWKQASVEDVAAQALAYLPAGTMIRAKIYPVIKPQTNSFVFEVDTDPAIFLYIDPKQTKEQFENTLTHELHHIGYAGSCSGESKQRPENVQNVLNWIGAFGEGVAMLAAAGGPDVHPHAVSTAEDRERWDRDMANFNTDLKKVEQFLADVLENKLSEEEIRQTGFSFFGIQGPWYTVGWKMAAVIEKTYDRGELIGCLCDSQKFLSTYNRAAKKWNAEQKESLALWPNSLLEEIR